MMDNSPCLLPEDLHVSGWEMSWNNHSRTLTSAYTYTCTCNVVGSPIKKNFVGKRNRKHVKLQRLWEKKESLDIDSIDPALPLDWSVFGWVNSVSRLHSEMQSNVMAGCNECFPVGWTVTLWMAGDLRPKGERIRLSCLLGVMTNFNWSSIHLCFFLKEKLCQLLFFIYQ